MIKKKGARKFSMQQSENINQEFWSECISIAGAASLYPLDVR
jgi:hypothetical protein